MSEAQVASEAEDGHAFPLFQNTDAAEQKQHDEDDYDA